MDESKIDWDAFFNPTVKRNGKVFLDNSNRPYFVLNGWLYYWIPS